MRSHEGKSVIVTGGASGIGRSCVERFVADGARVIIADLQMSKAQELAAALGSMTRAIQVDVCNEEQVSRLIDSALEFSGRLDIMVNNAGTMMVKHVVSTELAEWQRIFRINVDGVFLGARAAARQMIAQGTDGKRVAGVIVNAASTAARRAAAGVSAYCATKAAVELLTSALAIELAPHRIRVNATAPGFIDTQMWRELAAGIATGTDITPHQVMQRFADTVPWGRFGQPSEVAAVISWLASDEAEYVNGQCVSMNGAEMLF